MKSTFSILKNNNNSPVGTSRSTRMTRIRIRRWDSILGHWWCSILCRKSRMNRCSVFRSDRVGWCAVTFETWVSTFRLGAIVSAYLNHALEVHVHAIGEFEGLEVSEAHDRSARTEILDLLEPVDRTI